MVEISYRQTAKSTISLDNAAGKVRALELETTLTNQTCPDTFVGIFPLISHKYPKSPLQLEKLERNHLSHGAQIQPFAFAFFLLVLELPKIIQPIHLDPFPRRLCCRVMARSDTVYRIQ